MRNRPAPTGFGGDPGLWFCVELYGRCFEVKLSGSKHVSTPSGSNPFPLEVRLLFSALHVLDQELAWRKFRCVGGSHTPDGPSQADELGHILVLPVCLGNKLFFFFLAT